MKKIILEEMDSLFIMSLVIATYTMKRIEIIIVLRFYIAEVIKMKLHRVINSGYVLSVGTKIS